MYTYTWYQWLTFFYIYCFFGWIFESCYVSIRSGRFVNRGFLRLPLLPLYGSGAVMMLWVSIPFQDSLVLTYLAGVVGATVLEYVTGYVMEQLFKVRYWDYSNQKFNLHGYICLSSSIAWGFLTIFMTHLVHRPIEEGVLSMPLMWNLLFVVVVTAAFLYDAVICTKDALAFGQALEAARKLRQELDSLQVQAALLKMEAEDRFQVARSELISQLETKYGKRPTVNAIGLEELKQATKVKDKLGELKDLADVGLEEIKTQAGSKLEGFMEMTGITLEELKAKAGGKLDSLKDLKNIHLEELIGKSEEQLMELSSEKESRLNSLFSARQHFRKDRLRSNPTAYSRMYAQEFKAIKDFLTQNGKDQAPE